MKNKYQWTSLAIALLLLSACGRTDTTPPPIAQHPLIQVSSPMPNQLVTSPLKIEGDARGNWFFEASFPMELIDGQGNKLIQSYIMADGEWMTEEFVPFQKEFTFGKPKTETGTLILYKDNPSGLPENDDKIEIPVRFNLSDNNKITYQIEQFASGFEVPWDMAFTSNDRILVTERPGRLRVIEDREPNPKPIHIFSDVSSTAEEGLMSVELDPDYASNRWVYLSWAYSKDGEIKVKVARFKDAGDHLEDETLIIDNLPAAKYHAGCRLAFGPDKKLYISVGDALNRQDAQDLKSLAGKILRLNPDGTIPGDNPFAGSPVWSYGHRNVQGLAWHPETNELYTTEHGPSGFDGPPGGDELNHIVKGGNYGWPLVSHNQTKEGTIAPLITYTPAEPPGSLLIYSGEKLPEFKNHFFFGSLGGEGLMELVLDENDRVISSKKWPDIKFGRIRNVMEGPDGFIYFTTSNRDSRGTVDPQDDRIFRIRLA